MSWTRLAALRDLPPGALLEADHQGRLVALCNVAGDIRALSGVCPHHGGPLGEGALHNGVISCPWHMWPFDSVTGVCTMNEGVSVPVYAVRIEENNVLVDLP